MASAFDMFGKGEPAPKNQNQLRETYSELADEDEKDAVFTHSMQKGGLFGQMAGSPLKDYMPDRFKQKMPAWQKMGGGGSVMEGD